MWTYNYTDELYHHGIKGMRWGVRRFQNKDGSLTPAGKKRYDEEPKQKTTHRQRLEEKYRSSGMSAESAKIAADKRIKIEKIVAVTAGVTITAAAAYAVNKYVKEHVDGIIKAGTKMQVIANDPNKNLDRAFYLAYKKGDTTKYKGMYGQQLKLQAKFNPLAPDPGVHKISLDAKSDIKIASRQKAADAFAELYKTDTEFREAFAKSNSIFDTGGIGPRARVAKIASGKMTDRQLKRVGYDAFNIGLANHDENGNAIAKKFYDKLKAQGYDAIMDINDQKYSGYNSKKPVIVFNRGNKISISDVKQMTDEQIASNANKALNDVLVKTLAKTGAKIVGANVISNVATKTINSIKVDNYRLEHPGTKMTDKEILELLTKSG